MRTLKPRRRLPVIAAVASVALGTVVYAVVKPDDWRSEPEPTATRPERSPAPSLEPEIRWADYSGMALPVSPAAGPFHVRDRLASGFARTPQGALLAAVHITVRSAAQWGPKVFEPTITEQVIGPEQTALLAVARSAYERQREAANVSEGDPLGPGHAVIEAYRWLAYSPDLATVDIVSAGPGPHGTTVRASTRVQVKWDNGDWRVLAPPGGDWANSAILLASTTGYTPFQGRR
ncbi:hypothetical protein [Thermomonospora cellulosilytica]|uniref:DUF8175 domain-containing protein n=1 Tax=Thermomonospora cellulosilytica TaxID=1411118 RepID=A0A7W3MW06_9ACTN|nr:hypothetical protein [Thermomonospora cellulosilytica]MBA9002869.1 hypothetical protein [Thermomonospora cellulosilytica]